MEPAKSAPQSEQVTYAPEVETLQGNLMALAPPQPLLVLVADRQREICRALCLVDNDLQSVLAGLLRRDIHKGLVVWASVARNQVASLVVESHVEINSVTIGTTDEDVVQSLVERQPIGHRFSRLRTGQVGRTDTTALRDNRGSQLGETSLGLRRVSLNRVRWKKEESGQEDAP